MRTEQSFYTHIRQLIASDELREAVRLLQELLQNSPKLNEVILQTARLSDIGRQLRLGLVDHDQADQTKNQIRAGILELLDEIEAQEKVRPGLREEVERFAAGITLIQNAEKIYNIEKIDNADFS